jgi:hypothetical protein
VRDAEAHRRAMTISASYLPSAAEGERDPTHFVPVLSRGARGFATLGTDPPSRPRGYRRIGAGTLPLAARFAERLVREPGAYVLKMWCSTT